MLRIKLINLTHESIISQIKEQKIKDNFYIVSKV